MANDLDSLFENRITVQKAIEDANKIADQMNAEALAKENSAEDSNKS